MTQRDLTGRTLGVALALSSVACAHVAPKPEAPAPSPYLEEGVASVYADSLAGRATASGEPYQPSALTAAHRTLPLGTRVEVISLTNGRTVRVRINDRGPYAKGRIIDLSRAAAAQIGLLGLMQVGLRIPGAAAEASQ